MWTHLHNAYAKLGVADRAQAVLRVVLERVVGDLTLPDGVVVIAAANPPELAADGWDLSAPLANRFCHLDWPVEARAFAEGLTTGWAPPVVPPPRWMGFATRRRPGPGRGSPCGLG